MPGRRHAESPTLPSSRGHRCAALRTAACMAALFALATGVQSAEESLSTSAIRPTPIDPSGVVAGAFPAAGKTAFYLTLDVVPGNLLTQISYSGRPGAEKAIDLAVLDESTRARDSYWIHGSDPGDQSARAFAIDRPGKQLVRLEVNGPPTAEFRVELGGSAGAALAAKPATAPGVLSSSIFSPTPVGEDGIIAGKLPGVDRSATYYVSADLRKGDLLTQLTLVGREGPMKSIDFGLLEPNARTGAKYWLNDNGASGEKTRSFAIDRDGKQIIRISTVGPETGTFKVELGGTALAVQSGESGKIAQADASGAH